MDRFAVIAGAHQGVCICCQVLGKSGNKGRAVGHHPACETGLPAAFNPIRVVDQPGLIRACLRIIGLGFIVMPVNRAIQPQAHDQVWRGSEFLPLWKVHQIPNQIQRRTLPGESAADAHVIGTKIVNWNHDHPTAREVSGESFPKQGFTCSLETHCFRLVWRRQRPVQLVNHNGRCAGRRLCDCGRPLVLAGAKEVARVVQNQQARRG